VSDWTPIEMPDIGAGPHDVRVVQWLVDRGSEVLAGDRLLEVAVPGILFTVSAPCAGWLVELAVKMDDVVRPGDRLGAIERGEEET
jgi:pyruvate/2-oxoglutarate dehydrogenase complex dihydrolipoamide acyltransferase (E2) component